MKKITHTLCFLIASLLFLSCGDMANKAKDKLDKALTEQLEKAKAEAEKAESGTTQEIAEVEITKTSEKKANKEWWQDNFFLEFDFNPTAIFTGGKDSDNIAGVKGSLQRHVDNFRITSQIAGTKTNTIYRVEDGTIVKYLFNPDNNKASRSIPANQDRTIDYYVKNHLSEYTILLKKDPKESKEYEKDGNETFSGRKAEKWVAEKNIFGSITRATHLIDAEHRFALRAEAYMKIGETETSGTSLTVTDVSFRPDSKDVLIDFDKYEMIE